MKANSTDHCPVCGMKVASAQYKTQYHKMYFRFCSEQCHAMFEATPQLYASGTVEKRIPLLKTRKLRLARLCDAGEERLIEIYLLEMMGVATVYIQDDSLQVSYDLLQVTQARIEQRLNELEAYLDDNWWQRLRRGWIQNAEENELNNLARGSGACCNRPPPHV